MEKRVWKGKILSGKLNEYIQKHQNIWPEMIHALNLQGIHNYTIWNNGDEVIGYYECESLEYAEMVKSKLEICKKWSEDMQGIMELDKDLETGEVKEYKQIFLHL